MCKLLDLSNNTIYLYISVFVYTVCCLFAVLIKTVARFGLAFYGNTHKICLSFT